MSVTSTTSSSDRRALGLGRSRRRRRPGTAMVATGVLMVAVGAFAAGWSRSDDSGDASWLAGQEPPPTGSEVALDSSSTSAPSAARVAPAVAIPEGTEGVAVTLPFTAAGGGYVGSGDRVNIYLAADRPEAVVAVLRDVTVLDVSIEVAPRVVTGTAERSSASHITYLLAVPLDRVGDVVSAARTDGLYLSLVAGSGIAESPSDSASASVEQEVASS